MTGRVVDESNAALPGASIVVKGTSIGTNSGPDGSFTLKVPEGSEILVFSFIGMETREVPVTSDPMTITMSISGVEMDEVVVVGYGTQRKSEMTGASVTVQARNCRLLL